MDERTSPAAPIEPDLDLSDLVACHDCDLLMQRPMPRPGSRARCRRCGALLRVSRARSFERTLALSLAALVCFVLANAYPFLAFSLEGRTQEMTLFSGVKELWQGGFVPLAVLIFVVSIAVPLIKILGNVILMLSLSGGRSRRVGVHGPRAFRALAALHPWGMLEVYLLGVLVAFVKLSQMATVELGIAFHAFVALMLLTTASVSTLDPHEVWERFEAKR
ncbi:MAG: paraquat-inducible protein A [Myxococcota bacterium]|nr:paraquat-inducible protein A [Myxococcota bacterium]